MTTELDMIGQFVEDGTTVFHRFPFQVYWEDTDAGGIVYYANYLKFTERARTDLLRGLDINQQKMMTEDGLNFVVRDCRIEYLKPAKMDDSLYVETTVSTVMGASLLMHQEVIRDDVILIKSDVRVACIQKTGRPARFSPQIKDKFLSIVQLSGALKE
ncbi:MAG: tol-pal system-associated acyl-CoA thioesterase [Sneathiella sp.]|nr:tol-pal system-associated acyl-CoA thioesterase [Sneathiella sp.]